MCAIGSINSHLSNAKNLEILLYRGDDILPGYRGIVISHYKNPY